MVSQFGFGRSFKHRSRCLVALGVINLLLAGQLNAATLVHNVRGYTMNEGQRLGFIGLVYDQGVVTQLITDREELKTVQVDERFDGGGATLLPGLIDAHGHVAGLGDALASVDVTGTTSETAAVQRVVEAAARAPRGSWITGGGWNQVLWADRRFPTRLSLDEQVGDYPVVLRRVDRHAIWVNSAALAAAGIDEHTRDPEGGQILRDAQGKPTGVLVDNAMGLIASAMPAATVRSKRDDLTRAMNYLASLGLTGAHDAGATRLEVEAYDELVADDAMPIRIYAMLRLADPEITELLEQGPRELSSDYFALRSVKISADGALGSRGAALFEDYHDDPGNRGLLLRSATELAEDIRKSASLGYQVNVHAIGDLANARVLDEFAALNKDPAQRALRHRVEHAQILRPQDIDRFESLAVIASVQPTHATSDKNMAGDRLGEARLEGAYAWQSLVESGARLAGGSDFPVEPANPFFGLHAVVTRKDRDGQPLGGWRPEEALTRDQALSLFTEDAAYAGHGDQRFGRLRPGFAADFILVRDDFFRVPADDIWRNEVLATVVGGKLVYGTLAPEED